MYCIGEFYPAPCFFFFLVGLSCHVHAFKVWSTAAAAAAAAAAPTWAPSTYIRLGTLSTYIYVPTYLCKRLIIY
ncbi:hypothetical protein F5Y11DRAFT_334758 [Daldinia sp. FL1419]|nr:hypothetical protein F5Y11DRAFT_334758 [Daldinia sp. FL1419]